MTIFEFYKKFDTDKKCVDYLIKTRWPNGIACPHCGHNKHYITSIDKRNRPPKADKGRSTTEFKCANNKCHKKFNAICGTIFQATNIPLWQFFYLIFSAAINKKNVSSYQQAINLGIAQKTCWYIMARIRMLCWQDDKLKLNGDVEVDETYLATAKWKRPRKMKSRKYPDRKTPVLGLIQRGGNVIVKVIQNKDRRTVQDIIFKYVETDSKLFTDSAACYLGLSSYYLHGVINHKDGEYVRGEVHTNSIENFWNNLKMAIKSNHHGVSLEHLQGYCDELAYRWNNRSMSPLEIFGDLLKRACSIKPHGNKNVKLKVRENQLLWINQHEKVKGNNTNTIRKVVRV